MPDLLTVENLDARYGDFQALRAVDARVAEDEVLAIIGANGAGKTTLMRSIAGLIRNAPQQVRWKGRPIGALRADQVAALGIALVPEGRLLFPSLTVEENLIIGGQTGRKGPWNLAAVYRLFPILKERSEQLGGTLSGGQQQMCAIARGLVATPEVLMLDEVSLGLAPVMISRVYDAIRAIGDLGVTLLLVEQNVNQALSVADRAYVIQHGRVALSGTGKELQGNEEVRRIYLGLSSTEE